MNTVFPKTPDEMLHLFESISVVRKHNCYNSSALFLFCWLFCWQSLLKRASSNASSTYLHMLIAVWELLRIILNLCALQRFDHSRWLCLCQSEISNAIFHVVYHYFIYRLCGVMHLFCFNFSDIKVCTPVLLFEFYIYGLSLLFKDVVYCGKLSHIAGHCIYELYCDAFILFPSIRCSICTMQV